ncbi:MAG: hypothetical protein FWC43_12740 [Planctomycetaceae bacterium]|nr:hypothetical protein [Planctomycetaceae bacterium]MCL2306203.1 hypothetical protein [Planctomycetaceae bacterium]
MTNKQILTILLGLSFCTTFGAGQADAAFGDCISWIWGGKNESTTYSPPYSPTAKSMVSDSNQSGGQILGQSTSATPVYVTSPSYTGVRPDEYYPAPSYSAMKPIQPVTELRPVVKKEWTYAPVTSVAYKPVQQIDPQTGLVSTYYQAEESKTLLPWLHRKETVEYKPVLVPPKPVPAPQIVQVHYAGPQVQTPAAPVVYVSAYDPCNPCGNLVSMRDYSEPIPTQTFGDLTLHQSPNASSTASAFVSRNTGGRDVNYGIPPVREGYGPGDSRAYSQTYPGATPVSAADQVPVIGQSVQKPNVTLKPLISEADIRPVHPYGETVEKTETSVKSSNSITTPVPDLPVVKLNKEVPSGQKLVSPTQVHLKYQPIDAR